MSTFLVRPRLYLETVPQQIVRHKGEFEKARMQHTLKVVRIVARNLATRRLLGHVMGESEAVLEIANQVALEGVCPEHKEAAEIMVFDIYRGKVSDLWQ